MRTPLRKYLFETLYRNRYLYRFASTVPFAGQWRTWQRLVLPRLRGSEVLELGCGLGDLLADMLQSGYQCRAVEHSPEMVSATRQTLQRRRAGNPSTVIQGSSQYLPFPDASFDTVVSTFPSEYIYDPNTISEVTRVLRPNGRVIVVEAANLLPTGTLQSFLLLIQALVYGPGILTGLSRQGRMPRNEAESRPEDEIVHVDRDTGTGTTTQEIPNAPFGQHIPLEQAGLMRRSERVRSIHWEVYITIGEKHTK